MDWPAFSEDQDNDVTAKVTLQPRRIKWCERLAQARQNSAVEEGRPPSNFAPVEYSAALGLNVTGVFGEAAGMLYLNPKKWHMFQRKGLKDLPDYDGWVDVKTNQRHYRTNYLIIQQNDSSNWAYALCYPRPHPIYMLAGWCYGYEARKENYLGDLSGQGRLPAYNVPHDDYIIKPIGMLRRLMREKNGLG